MDFDEESEIKQQNEGAPPVAPAAALISPTSILQVGMLPFTILIYFLSNFKTFFANMRVPVLTKEQEAIMKSTPHEQQTIRSSMRKVTADQEKIGKDIGDLKARLARLEERKRERMDALESLNQD
jgi:hypothetical protein